MTIEETIATAVQMLGRLVKSQEAQEEMLRVRFEWVREYEAAMLAVRAEELALYKAERGT